MCDHSYLEINQAAAFYFYKKILPVSWLLNGKWENIINYNKGIMRKSATWVKIYILKVILKFKKPRICSEKCGLSFSIIVT